MNTILKGAWRPSLNISTVLTSIQLLMAEPNPDDPLMADIVSVSLFLFTPHVFCHTIYGEKTWRQLFFLNIMMRIEHNILVFWNLLLCCVWVPPILLPLWCKPTWDAAWEIIQCKCVSTTCCIIRSTLFWNAVIRVQIQQTTVHGEGQKVYPRARCSTE